MEYTGSSGNNKKTMSNQQTNLSKNLVVSVLCSFGGMEKNNTVFSYVTNGKNETMVVKSLDKMIVTIEGKTVEVKIELVGSS